MKHLIVYAHPNAASFNHGVLEAALESLKSMGHEVHVRDLYALGFDPVLKLSDLAELHAGRIPSDIAAEQELVRWADVITFIYPTWWTGLPAILKGWVDRVFTYGFAYAFGPEGLKGLLAGKRAVLLSSHGQPREVYEKKGMYEALRLTQEHGIFEFCGLEIAARVFFPSAISADETTRKGYLAQVKQTMEAL